MDPIPFDVCRSTSALESLAALSGTRVSIPTLGPTPGELSVDALSLVTAVGPFVGACVALLVCWWGASRSRTTWGRAVLGGATLGGALCTLTLAGWGALHLADAWRADARYIPARNLLRLTAVVDPLLTHIGRADAPALRLAELTQFEAIRTHLSRAHVDSAIIAAEWPLARSRSAAGARTTAWLAMMQRQLDGEQLPAALAAAHAASKAAHAAQSAVPFLAEVEDALGLAHARAAAAAVRELSHTAARQHVDAIAAEWRPTLRATVDGATAIAEASAALGDSLPDEPQLQRALGHLERAFIRDRSHAVAALRCAVADTRGALASFGLANGRDVVPILREAERHVVGMARLERLMDPALLLLGAQQLQAGDGDGAVATLEEHWDRFEPRDKGAARQLAGAYALAATQAAEHGDMQGAVELIERAVARMPGDEQMYHALGAARLARADAHLAAGSLDAGREELVAVMDFPAERARAEQKLHALAGAEERLLRLRAVARWSPIPLVDGETWDLDEAGVPRHTYHARGLPVAVDDSSGYQVNFPGDTPGSAMLVDDSNHDAAFDRVTVWQTTGERREIADLDFDRRPDVIRDFHANGRLRQLQPLSGSVRLWPKAGAIGILTDVPVGTYGEADGYVVLRRNGREVARTEVVPNNRFPQWRRALHVDYRWGDELRIEVHDRDLLFDDFIDGLTIRDFPRNASLVTERGTVALDLDVTEAPCVSEGMVSILPPPTDHALLRPGHVPEIVAIVAQANALDMNKELARLVTRTVVVETLAWTLVRRGQVLRLGVALALDGVIPANIP